jgi:hypothetical protein
MKAVERCSEVDTSLVTLYKQCRMDRLLHLSNHGFMATIFELGRPDPERGDLETVGTFGGTLSVCCG